MIACKYAETTRVKRKRRVNPKLRAEVSNRMLCRDCVKLQAQLRREIRLKTFVEVAHTFHVDRIGRSFGKSKGRCFGQELTRVVFTFFPDFRIEISEDTLAIGGPAPPVIPGQAFEWNQWRGQVVV